jgi:N-methylhydantoinase A/oxoprolinase/acetone carboxylase beta subunit
VNLVIGIDTGGTYTDAVLMDRSSGQIKGKAKALTTPHDLSIGISQALDGLGCVDFKGVKMVSISTTLATNAIVEGHGGRVALLLIGYDHEIIEQQGLAKRLPVQAMYYISGGHDVKGEEVSPLDTDAASNAIQETRDKVDAYAISGYFSVMNPDHELRLRDMVHEQSSAPVVCGHELTNKLNALKRVSTTVLNARLLPLVQHLLDSVSKVLAERRCDARLMVVKGDGSLISEAMARQRPVDTILSGPAASAIGAQFLSGENNSIVVDIGGTTTDIAILKDGLPWGNPAGATVGGWQTCVQAADLHSFGLGGDSHIQIESGSIVVGPRHAIPLFRLGYQYPEIVRELELARRQDWLDVGIQAIEFLTLVSLPNNLSLSVAEISLVQELKQGPLSLMKLRRIFKDHTIPLERLEMLGFIQPAGLTPTDVLWSQADQIPGNGEAARVGCELMARQLDIPVGKLSELVVEQMTRRIAVEILDKLISDQINHSLYSAPRAWDKLLECLLGADIFPEFSGYIQIHKPIIAIGAPVACYMPKVAELLHTQCVIPSYAEVGNAVGAAVASITHTVEVLVQPQVMGGGTLTYLVHSPIGREVIKDQDQAVLRAEEIAKELAAQWVRSAGGQTFSITVNRQTITMGILSEVTVRACAKAQSIRRKSFRTRSNAKER